MSPSYSMPEKMLLRFYLLCVHACVPEIEFLGPLCACLGTCFHTHIPHLHSMYIHTHKNKDDVEDDAGLTRAHSMLLVARD